MKLIQKKQYRKRSAYTKYQPNKASAKFANKKKKEDKIYNWRKIKNKMCNSSISRIHRKWRLSTSIRKHNRREEKTQKGEKKQ